MTKDNTPFGSLFWRISAAFVITLLIFAGLSIYVFSSSLGKYTSEVSQDLNADLAAHTAKEIAPFIEDGQVNQEGMGAIMHSMMTINPSVEVYILDNAGEILSYVAPYKEVKMERVALAPIQQFITTQERNGIIEGDDPRTPGKCKIFSAAPILEDGVQAGYVYIVLAGQKYDSVTDHVLGSYILGITLRTVLIVLLLSMLVGLIAFWLITKRLKQMVASMEAFKRGELSTRIGEEGGPEFVTIAKTFNGMADSLQSNIEELESVDRLRKELISNISHDLRTPISSIQGYAETLEMKHGSLDEQTSKDYLATIVKNSKKLNELVGGLFELSKLESGGVTLSSTPFSIAELVHDVAAKYRLASQKKGISINVTLEKGSPTVMGDISMVDRVLQNLIDNAIKFCSEGDYINIELDVSKPEMVEVRIADSGDGIAQDKLPYIFDRYFTTPDEKNTDGSGLGLSIAKKIVELHGGTIRAESRVSQGSTFSFTLPTAA